MSAVDSPGSPGLNYEQLGVLIGELSPSPDALSDAISPSIIQIVIPTQNIPNPVLDCIAPGNPQPSISGWSCLMNSANC